MRLVLLLFLFRFSKNNKIQGHMKNVEPTALAYPESATEKKRLDREAILRLSGTFKVSFDFAETFSPNADYEREDLYKNGAVEYVFPIKNEDDFISLQHILVINGVVVVKHWRQDWIYENREFLSYFKDNTWKKYFLPKEKVKGTWTQKVYQVDDSPRYESFGTWLFVDGKEFWESNTDAPLPRRQMHRKDYNVLNRTFRIELRDSGWMMDQDNQKIYRDDQGNDQLIVWEKGFEVMERGDFDVSAGKNYWEKHKEVWTDIREAFKTVIAENQVIKFRQSVSDKLMYDYVFDLVKKFGGENYDRREAQKGIAEIIDLFLVRE